jgi:hypothetical protein
MVNNVSTPELWDRIYNKFDSTVCKQCFILTISKHSKGHPQPIPYVGTEFKNDEYKLMFIGIETWNARLFAKKNANHEDFDTSTYYL